MTLNYALTIIPKTAVWVGGAVAQRVERCNLRSTGLAFKSYSGQKLRNNLGKIPVTMQYNFLPAKRW